MTTKPVVEWWVMRAVLHDVTRERVQLTMFPAGSTLHDAIVAKVDAGDFALLPDSTICEPIEVFDDEPSAHAHRAKLQAAHPAEDFRVILNADVTV